MLWIVGLDPNQLLEELECCACTSLLLIERGQCSARRNLVGSDGGCPQPVGLCYPGVADLELKRAGQYVPFDQGVLLRG